MRKLILVLCFWSLITAPTTAFATKELKCSDGESKTGETWYHQHCYTDKDTHRADNRKDPAGIGADILIHETEDVDFFAEYKRDFNNNEHSVFAVVKTKRSLVDIVKGFFKKGE
jgi:hypothetical protein